MASTTAGAVNSEPLGTFLRQTFLEAPPMATFPHNCSPLFTVHSGSQYERGSSSLSACL
jgi:hypothetical protein